MCNAWSCTVRQKDDIWRDNETVKRFIASCATQLSVSSVPRGVKITEVLGLEASALITRIILDGTVYY